jgi:cytochrome c oxidase assembly factor CtaG
MVYHQLESGGRTLLYVKDRVALEVTGNSSARIQFDDKVTSYMVEECVLEKVTPEEVSIYQEQIKLFIVIR